MRNDVRRRQLEKKVTNFIFNKIFTKKSGSVLFYLLFNELEAK